MSLGFNILRQLAVTDAVLVSSTVPETDYAEWNPATAYVIAPVPSRVIRAALHKVYERVVAGTSATAPEDDVVNWKEVGATLRWQMFDGSTATQTTAADGFTVELEPGVPCTCLWLYNVAGMTVQLQVEDPVEGIVSDQTVDMISDSGITDWYAYFFEPIERKSTVLFANLPPFAGATLRIIVTNTGGTAAVGMCLIGQLREIGGTQFGPSLGIKDFSEKTTDKYGGYTVTEREFINRGRFMVELDNNMVDVVHRLLSEYRATPTLYIASERFDCMQIYGKYDDFDIVIPGPRFSTCAIQIEGIANAID